MMKTEGHTPTPWYADDKGKIWRRNPSELYENGGGVAGDFPIAMTTIGGVNWDNNFPRAHNANLIVTAVNERGALLQCAEALRGAARFIEECAKHRPLDTAEIFAAMMPIRAALSLLDEARR